MKIFLYLYLFAFLLFSYIPVYSPIKITNNQLETSIISSNNVINTFFIELDKFSLSLHESKVYDKSLSILKGLFTNSPTIQVHSIPLSTNSNDEIVSDFLYNFNLNINDKSISKLKYKILKEFPPVSCNNIPIISYIVELYIPVFNSLLGKDEDNPKRILYRVDVCFYENNGITDPKINYLSEVSSAEFNNNNCKEILPIKDKNFENNKIKFNIIPYYSKVYIDNVYKGTGNNTTVELSQGMHIVMVTSSSYDTFTKKIFVDNNDVELTKTLKKQSGKLSIEEGEFDYGANVEVDGELVGYVPVDIKELSVGTHSVRIKKRGYYAMSTSVYVANKDIVTLTPNLVSLNKYNNKNPTQRVNNFITTYAILSALNHTMKFIDFSVNGSNINIRVNPADLIKPRNHRNNNIFNNNNRNIINNPVRNIIRQAPNNHSNPIRSRNIIRQIPNNHNIPIRNRRR